jgi:hypothetical protein
MGLPPSSVPTSNTSRRQLAAHPSAALISRVQNFRRKMCRTASAPSSDSRPGDGLFARWTEGSTLARSSEKEVPQCAIPPYLALASRSSGPVSPYDLLELRAKLEERSRGQSSPPQCLSPLAKIPINVSSGKVWHYIRVETFTGLYVVPLIAIDQQLDTGRPNRMPRSPFRRCLPPLRGGVACCARLWIGRSRRSRLPSSNFLPGIAVDA